jgi:hypothetical protein
MLLLLCTLLGLLSMGSPALAVEGTALLKQIDANLQPEAFESYRKLINIEPNGNQREFLLYTLKKGQDKIASLFLAPASEKGRATLRLGDNMWLYIPNVGKPIRITSLQSVVGGVFNNADIMRLDYHVEYDVQTLADLGNEYLLERKSPGRLPNRTASAGCGLYPPLFGLDRDAALYRLRFFDRDAGNLLAQYDLGLRPEGSYRQGIFSLFARADILGRNNYLGWDAEARLFEGFFSLKPSPSLALDAGKKVVKWGKGYAWSPVAFVDRPKNPEDPEEALEGFYLLHANFIRSFAGPVKTLAFTPVVLPVFAGVNDDFGMTDHMHVAAKLYCLCFDAVTRRNMEKSRMTTAWSYGFGTTFSCDSTPHPRTACHYCHLRGLRALWRAGCDTCYHFPVLRERQRHRRHEVAGFVVCCMKSCKGDKICRARTAVHGMLRSALHLLPVLWFSVLSPCSVFWPVQA